MQTTGCAARGCKSCINRMLCYRLGGAVLIRVVRWALPTPCTVTRFQSGLEPLEVVFLSRQPSEVKTCQYSLTVAKRARTRPSVVRLRRLSNPALAKQCAGGRSYAYVEYRDRLGPSRSPFGQVAQCTVGHGQMSVSMPIHVERGSVAREFGQVMGCRGA